LAQIDVERLALLIALTALSAAGVGTIEQRPGVEAVIGVRTVMLRYWERPNKLLDAPFGGSVGLGHAEGLLDLPLLAVGGHLELRAAASDLLMCPFNPARHGFSFQVTVAGQPAVK
jgi:hypothetical protein